MFYIQKGNRQNSEVRFVDDIALNMSLRKFK